MQFIKERIDVAVAPVASSRAVAKPIEVIRDHFEIVQNGLHQRTDSEEQVPCTWYTSAHAVLLQERAEGPHQGGEEEHGAAVAAP